MKRYGFLNLQDLENELKGSDSKTSSSDHRASGQGASTASILLWLSRGGGLGLRSRAGDNGGRVDDIKDGRV